MAKCWSCGTETADTWRFCSKRKEFVCVACEKICANYSKRMLPNGCHCRLTYFPADYYRYLCDTNKYKEFCEKYQSFTLTQLNGRFQDLKSSYNTITDGVTSAVIRAELAALHDLIKERRQANDTYRAIG